MSNCAEIIGVRKIALYINDEVRINRPNPSEPNEVDIIAHAQGSFVIENINELPKWSRIVDYSGNYKQNYFDEFSFLLHGIKNNVPGILRSMRNNRKGYIVEIITTGGDSFVFPTPVFLNTENTKQIDSRTWDVSLSYRVATFEDYLVKLNTTLMIYSYILLGNNTILGDGTGAAIVSN